MTLVCSSHFQFATKFMDKITGIFCIRYNQRHQ
jgi:hypothetical protein